MQLTKATTAFALSCALEAVNICSVRAVLSWFGANSPRKGHKQAISEFDQIKEQREQVCNAVANMAGFYRAQRSYHAFQLPLTVSAGSCLPPVSCSISIPRGAPPKASQLWCECQRSRGHYPEGSSPESRGPPFPPLKSFCKLSGCFEPL